MRNIQNGSVLWTNVLLLKGFPRRSPDHPGHLVGLGRPAVK
jgi:hypothetical protein